jgi:hypothetical protein
MTAPSAVHLGTGGRPRCGRPHPRPWQLTSDHDAVTCRYCLNLMAGTHHVGVLAADVKPHGSIPAIRRHYRRREELCDSCKQAEQRDTADRYRRTA